MLIAPSTLTHARARRLDLEREADHERLLRAARAALRACGVDEARGGGEPCGTHGCRAHDAGAPQAAPRRPAGRPRALWVSALLRWAGRPSRPTHASRCTPACPAA